jgi:radical SAM protein with 4Fe4S-binding SPASM domain
MKFLTDKKIDVLHLIFILKQNAEKYSGEDAKILQGILFDFEKNDLGLLTPQEIYFLNNNSEDVWTDYLIFRYKFKIYPKQKIVSTFPIYLLIEPISTCNLRCIMCFQIDDSFNSTNEFMGHMDIKLFKKIIDEAEANGTKAITLASRGEPTLHPKLNEMLDYCTNKFFELKLNTNATKLTEKLIHKILQSGITDLVFSVDSYKKDDYERIRVRGIFETVVENIKNFAKIRQEFYPNSKCATRVSGVRVDKDFNMNEFKQFWEKYVDHVVVVEMENRWDTYHNPLEVGAENPCQYLWERMYVWFDGKCNPCDADYKTELELGTIQTNSIKEIWHGQRFSDLRAKHLKNQRNTCYPCDRCPIGE